MLLVGRNVRLVTLYHIVHIAMEIERVCNASVQKDISILVNNFVKNVLMDAIHALINQIVYHVHRIYKGVFVSVLMVISNLILLVFNVVDIVKVVGINHTVINV